MAAWMTLITISLPWVGALLVWWIGDKHPRVQHVLAVVFSALAGLASLILLAHTTDEAVVRVSMGGIFGDFTLVPDGLGVLLAIIAAVIGSLAVIFSMDYMASESQLGRYYALVLLFIGAMIGLVLSGSLLLMFIFWEITAFCSYALISFHNDDPKAVAGGIKALIMTQLGGVGLLAGAIISYTQIGIYDIDLFLEKAGNFPPSVLGVVGFGFLVAAMAKSAQAPLHTWLPDAMEAPTPVSALIHAATMVNAGVYLLARFYPAFEGIPGWATTVVIVGVVSALLSAVMAVAANDLKRVLAYSTISQLGYMIYAIGNGAILASQIHLLSHAVFKALLFLGTGAVINSVEDRDMRSMGGVGKDMPYTRFVFVVGVLGLTGLPLSNGFFSKELILENGLAHGALWSYVCMLFGVGLTAFYSIRMLTMVFYGQAKHRQKIHDAPAAMRFSLGFLAFATLTTWLASGLFEGLLQISLPNHDLQAHSTWDIVLEVFSTPATYLAILVIALGAALYLLRERLGWFFKLFRPVAGFVEGGLGFEWLNQQVIGATTNTAAALCKTQTGYLNWNVADILAAMIVLLVILL
ncbi:MAG: NADH-quinone oxidoreductase subunit L [Anaerolineales bacterium]|jgi:NADH-quinone oxidoreductase subunit L